MAIPTQSDFQEVEKVILQRRKKAERITDPYFYSGLRADYQPKNLLNEITIEACNNFVGCLYDDWVAYRRQIESLKAYKWLRADPSCKFALKDLFGTYNPVWPTRDEYVSNVGTRLFGAAAPVTKVHFYLMEQSRQDWLEWDRERLRFQSFTEDEVEKELSNDGRDWENFDEINSKEKRLIKLNIKAAEIQESFFSKFGLIGGNFFIHLLSVMGDYFYNPESLINHEEVVRGEEYETVDQDEVDRINKGVQSIIDLIPFLQNEIDYEGEGVLVERYKKIIGWLNILKEHSKNKIHSEHCVDDIGFKPIIKRKDKDDKAKTRALAFHLWKVIKRNSRNRPVSALLNLLSIEGISPPHERTVERWLAQWEKEWGEKF